MLFKADLEIPFDKNAIVQQVKTQSHTNSNTTCNRSEPERVLIVLSSVSISARAAKTKCFFTNQNTPCQELQRHFIVSHIIYIHTRVENPLLRINLLFCVILFNLFFSLCVDNQARLHYVENSQVLNATAGKHILQFTFCIFTYYVQHWNTSYIPGRNPRRTAIPLVTMTAIGYCFAHCTGGSCPGTTAPHASSTSMFAISTLTKKSAKRIRITERVSLIESKLVMRVVNKKVRNGR